MPPKGGSNKSADLGRAIQRRAIKDKRAKRSDGTGFHIADMSQSNHPLQSVTEATSLEEFMAAASMADRSFTAEKANITFVSDHPVASAMAKKSGAFGPIATPSLRDAVSGTIASLSIPRRPAWDDTTTAEELHRREKDAFLAWRRSIAQTELDHGAGLASGDATGTDGTVAASSARGEVTPFEKNIEVWRQLWRVVEKSDVLVQIVDARNALLYRCPDLEVYVTEMNATKCNLLLMNKADYLTPPQRLAWARHFTAQGVDFVFFSAKREQQRLEAQDHVQQSMSATFSATAGIEPAMHDEDSDEGGVGSGLAGRWRGGVGAAEESMAHTVANIAASQAEKQRAKRESGLIAAMRASLMPDSDTDSEEGTDEREARRSRKKAALAKYRESAAAEVESEVAADGEEEEEEKEEATPAPIPNTQDAMDRAVDELMTIKDDNNVGIDPTDPLFEACRVLTRQQLLDFLADRYESLPRVAVGSGDANARQKKAEWMARKREEAKAARKAELEKRREQVQRMIEVGLGAHVRFGDAADARALDEEDEDEEGGADGDEEEVPPLMVGMVGYPNVGKSSTINALLGATAGNHGTKRVAVASTPGKTKHFQTLPLNDDVTLCDCPGLVFPSFVHTREEMIVNGVLPIDQMRDYLSPIRLLCQRIPRAVLEKMYGIKLPVPGAGQPGNRQPTPAELLDTYCFARGFSASTHGGLDHPRGSRLLLKDYCDGRLVYAHPPPGGWALASRQAWAAEAGLIISAGLASSSRALGGGKAGVIFSDNVLLPTAQRRHDGAGEGGQAWTPPPTVYAPLYGEQGVGGGVAAAASSHPDPVACVVEGEGEGEESAVDEGEDSMDEDDLLAFAKVIVVRKDKGAAGKGAARSHEQANDDAGYDVAGSNAAAGARGRPPASGDGGTDGGDADARYTATVLQGRAVAALSSLTGGGPAGAGVGGRTARVRGLGGHGRRKKGERETDPYGTEAAADAASRRYVAAEIAAVTSGPASAVSVDALAAAAGAVNEVGVHLPTLAQGAAARRAGPPVNTGSGVKSKVVYDAGGATVMDAVPVHLRGQQHVPVPVAISASLLRKKLSALV